MEKNWSFPDLVQEQRKPPTVCTWSDTRSVGGSIVEHQIFMVPNPTHSQPVRSVVGPTGHRSDHRSACQNICHDPSLHPGRGWHSTTIVGPQANPHPG
uniref:Uncharacterized protein n=1 Tax=Solanum tuberosum TaxID=4113 RepID=M1DL52_SOLTU